MFYSQTNCQTVVRIQFVTVSVSQLPFGEVTSKQQHSLPSLLIDFVYLNCVLTTRTVNQFLRFYSLLRTERVVIAFGKEAAITSEASPDLAILKLYPCDLMPR